MSGLFCTTCGSVAERLESHHVAGRKFSPVTTMLCIPCHYFCTIAGTYERVWHTQDVIPHLWAGILDVWNRFAQCNSLPTGRKFLYQGESQNLWTYRPCSAVAEIRYQISDKTLPDQAREFLRLTRELTKK